MTEGEVRRVALEGALDWASDRSVTGQHPSPKAIVTAAAIFERYLNGGSAQLHSIEAETEIVRPTPLDVAEARG